MIPLFMRIHIVEGKKKKVGLILPLFWYGFCYSLS